VERTWVRSAAFSCAFACGALVVGPGMTATAVAHAGLFGIDFFGHDDNKSRQHHPRPGSDAAAQESGAQESRTTAGVAAAGEGPPVAKIGSEPVSASRASAPQSLAATSAPESVTAASAPESLSRINVPENRSRGGGGGGEVPRSFGQGRASNLPPVPTAPETRSVVIRGVPEGAPAPLFVPRAPVTVPLAAPPPAPPAVEGQLAPAAPPSPSPSHRSPLAKIPGVPIISGAGELPGSFRAGYAEYLRSASTSDLFFAALPGVAGIAGFTLVGAFAGFRRARGVQKALLTPVPTRVVL
jgi:hypothetical protein